MSKKGFLFVITIFLILTYILLSISVWVKSIETSERYYSEFYKESNLELVSSQITSEKVSDVTNSIMTRALYKLSEHSATNPIISGPIGNENSNIQTAMRTLFVDGNASASLFETSNGLSIDPTSLRSWVLGLNNSLGPSGAFVSDYSVSQFSISQTHHDAIDYTFNLTLKISDYSNLSSVTKNYLISDSVLLSGFVDPALLRESTSASRPIYRQFFFNSIYSDPSSISVYKYPNASLGGQGWLYAPLAAANSLTNPELPLLSNASLRSTYILVGTYSDIVATEGYDEYAGYIVTSAPSSGSSCDTFVDERNTFKPLSYRRDRSGLCTPSVNYANGNPTSKPFIVVPGFSAGDSRFNCPGSQKCALINSQYDSADLTGSDLSRKVTHLRDSHVGIFGIESVRDFLLCGYYLPSETSPSFLQRMFSDSYNRTSPYGIETFVVGEYSDVSRLSNRSRVDTEIFNSALSGIKLKGTVGCKDRQSCSSDLTTGQFMLSADAIRRYHLEALSCALGARC